MTNKEFMVKKLLPLRDRLLIKKLKPEEVITTGGIIIPGTVSDATPPQIGEVLAVGEGLVTMEGVFIPTTIKVGQKVTFPKYCGTDAKIYGKDCFILPESEVLAVFD